MQGAEKAEAIDKLQSDNVRKTWFVKSEKREKRWIAAEKELQADGRFA